MERTIDEWSCLIRSAIKSGQQLKRWCREHGIERSTFYYYCNVAGFIKDGKRTEKWTACSTESDITDSKDAALDVPENHFLVPVPKQTVIAAMQENRNGMVSATEQACVLLPGIVPAACIQRGPWNVFIDDCFKAETLKRVLEVISDAQGS